MCQAWVNDFDKFVEDMGEAPEGKSLDRIDVDKGYSPDNCRWATPKQQANNKRGNKRITYDGETLTQSEWAERLGISVDALYRRLEIYKMDLEKALTPRSLKTGWSHGTRTGYENHKCRCAECTKANTERHRKIRAALIERCIPTDTKTENCISTDTETGVVEDEQPDQVG